MKIAISGSSGLVGSALLQMFEKEGHEVLGLERDILYGPAEDLQRELDGVQVVIHLAGAPLTMRWTGKNKKIIYDSRIITTRNLVQAMKGMSRKPAVFICASAATLYPEEGIHTEESKAETSSFLGKVAHDWEAEAAKASTFCRTLHFRIGMVLSPRGGALKTMLPPFRLGVGGRVGSGKQMISWIHIEDFLRIVRFVIQKEDLSGVVNITTPHPVNNAQFSKVLARTIHRPSFMIVPPFLLRLLYGKSSRVVIRGVNVLPKKLLDAGYRFRFPELKAALKDLLG